jgi:hypothetical protein
MRSWNAVLVCMCIVWVCAMVIVTAQPTGGVISVFQSPNGAAWVQAIGSIAAISAAIVIAGHESRERRRQRVDLIAQFAALAIPLIEECEPGLHLIPEEYAGDTSKLKRLCETLDAIPLHEIGDGTAAVLFWNLRQNMLWTDANARWIASEQEAEAMKESGGPEDEDYARFERLKAEALSLARKLIDHLEGL